MDPFIDPDSLDPRHPATPRKLDNLALASAAMDARKSVVDALPSKVTFQTTDACNLACPHCQISVARKKPRMDEQLLVHLERELLPDLIELHPTNVGEPFAWRPFRRLCRLLHDHGVVLDLTTNGTLLDPHRVEWIAPIARDVKVSFDGATAATFERLRRGASFEAVCDNVRGLVARLHRVRARRPIVALQMTLMRSNVRELPDLVRLGADLGVDRIKAYHLFSFSEDLDAESLMPDLDRWTPVLEEALGLGQELGLDMQIAEPPAPGNRDLLPTRACFLPWHETWIDVDGAVLLCHSHGNEVAGWFGKRPFADIWNGPLLQRVRAGFAAGRPVGACDGCGMTRWKASEHEPVPYDPASFLSPTARSTIDEAPVRWSGRMRPFDLRGRRDGTDNTP